MNSGDSMLEKFNNILNLQAGLEFKFADFLINQIVDAAFCLGETAQFLYVNKATCLLTEYSHEELLSMKLDDLDVDSSLHNWSEQWHNLKNIDYLSFKSRYRTKGGRTFFAELNLIYIQYQSSEFCCGYLRENTNELVELSVQKWINEGREIQNQLQQESAKIKPQHIDTLRRVRESRFRTLLEATNASIFLIQDTKICYVNPAAELLTGYTKKELLADFDFNQLIKSRKSKHRQANNSEYQEINILTKDSTERWLDVTVTRFDGGIDFDGQEVEVLTAIDITDYKYIQLELRQILEQAKKISELRAKFLARFCHQFRTKLNVISFSNSLLKRHIDQWQGEKILLFIIHIQTAVEQITQVLDDMIFLAKTESENVVFDPKSINLVDFCEELIAKTMMLNNDKYINFQSRGTCFNIWIDQKILEQILNNLLENAIKYSPQNSVVDLMVDCFSEKIIFQVKDQGIGIPEEDQERLFEPFYRGSNVGNISGTGLGLSIVKSLVDLHGGQITVVSEVGAGTTSTVVLPSVPYCESGIF